MPPDAAQIGKPGTRADVFEVRPVGIRSAADGGAQVSSEITMRLIESLMQTAGRNIADPHHIQLRTPRERAVSDRVVAGSNNTEIAAELFISDSTVMTHLNRILYKLERRDRVHLVLYAYEHALGKSGHR